MMEAIHTLNELGNTLLDSWSSRTSTVCTNRADSLQQPSRPLNNIRLVSQLVQQDILLLQKWGIFHQAQHLSEERNGLLIQLLRVSNIGRNNLIERQTLRSLRQLRSILLRPHRQLSSNRVLRLLDMRVDIIDIQTAELRSRRHLASRCMLCLSSSSGESRGKWRVIWI